MKLLDKTKPYGEIYGHAPYRYEQDGCFFYTNGEMYIDREIKNLPWQTIQKLVKKNGGKASTKAHGIEFLEGLEQLDTDI